MDYDKRSCLGEYEVLALLVIIEGSIQGHLEIVVEACLLYTAAHACIAIRRSKRCPRVCCVEGSINDIAKLESVPVMN